MICKIFFKKFLWLLLVVLLLPNHGFSLPGKNTPKKIVPTMPSLANSLEKGMRQAEAAAKAAAKVHVSQSGNSGVVQIVPLANRKPYFRAAQRRSAAEWWRLVGLFLDQYERLPQTADKIPGEELFVEGVSEIAIRKTVNHYFSRARQTGETIKYPQAQRFKELLRAEGHLEPKDWVDLLEKYLEKYGSWPKSRLTAEEAEREVEGVTWKEIRKKINLILQRADNDKEGTSEHAVLAARIRDLKEKYKHTTVKEKKSSQRERPQDESELSEDDKLLESLQKRLSALQGQLGEMKDQLGALQNGIGADTPAVSSPTVTEIKKHIEKKINPIVQRNKEKWLELLKEFIDLYGNFPRADVPLQEEVRMVQGIEEQKLRHAVDNYVTRLHSGKLQRDEILSEFESLKKQYTRSHYMADEPERQEDETRLINLAERFVGKYGVMPRSILPPQQEELFIEGIPETELRRKLNYMKARAEKKGEDNPAVQRFQQLLTKYGFGSIDKKREEEKACLDLVEEFLINYGRLPRSSLTDKQAEVVLQGVEEHTIRRRMNYFLARAKKENRADDPTIQRLQELLNKYGYYK